MKILLLSHYYAPEQGAPQQRWAALAGHFVRAGHDFRVIAPSPHYPGGALLPGSERLRPGTVHEGTHGETVHRVSFREYAGDVGSRFADQSVAAVSAVRAARTQLRTWRPDVVIATVPSLPMLWAGRRVARLLGAPLIAEMRDAWPDLLTVVDEWDSREQGRAGRRRFLPVTRGAMGLLGGATTAGQRRADAVVTTTDTFAEALRRRGIRGVHVVRNGAHPLPGYAGHSPRQPDGTLRVLYAGTIGRAQGLSTAVRAAALAADRGVPIRLRLVGSGADLPHLAVLADRLAAPVDLWGPTPRSAMEAHYDWADSVLVSLRPWPALSLTVPSKLYEAMALGVHVSGSVSGEAADIIADAGAGHVAPAGDAETLAQTWEHLAHDPTGLEVESRGREWVAEHADNRRLGEAYLDLIAEVVGSRVR